MVNVSHPMMTPALQEFIQHKVNSFVRWDLLRYFHENATRKETAEGVAKNTGRDVHTVERELEALVVAQLLIQEQKGNTPAYRLVKDKALRQQIADFMHACHDRHFRVEVIQQVIKAMNFSPRYDF